MLRYVHQAASAVFSVRVSDVGIVQALLVGVILIAILGLHAGAQERSASRPEIGLIISHKWCSRCHIVSGKPRKRDGNDLPAFIEIANTKRITRAYLLRLLSSPQGHLSPRHGVMPAAPLTRAEINHVIAYIETLRSKR